MKKLSTILSLFVLMVSAQTAFADNVLVSLSSTNPDGDISVVEMSRVFEFQFGYEFDAQSDVEITKLKFEFDGSGVDKVENVKLINDKNAVLDEGLLSNSKVTFTGDFDAANRGKFTLLVDISDDALTGKNIRASLIEADLHDVVTDFYLDISSQLPLRGKSLIFVDGVSENSVDTGDLKEATPKDLNQEPASEPDKKTEESIEPKVEVKYENPFSDISGSLVEDVKGKAAIYLYAQKMITGYVKDGKTEFKGFNQLNRAEVTKFIINSLGYTDKDYCEDVLFKDVKKEDWYNKYVCTAVGLGIIKGYGDGTFKGTQLVTKSEFLKMLVEAHKLNKNLEYSYPDVDSSAWYVPYVGVAQELRLFPDSVSKFEPNKVLNRWETAVAIYLVLNK